MERVQACEKTAKEKAIGRRNYSNELDEQESLENDGLLEYGSDPEGWSRMVEDGRRVE